MKFSLKTLLLVITIACVFFVATDFAFRKGYQQGFESASGPFEVKTYTGCSAPPFSEKTTDEVLNEILASVDEPPEGGGILGWLAK